MSVLVEIIGKGEGKKAQGLKPDDSIELIGTTEQLAEKGLDFDEIGEKQTSGPKGRVDLLFSCRR
jgi:hypothetical protein